MKTVANLDEDYQEYEVGDNQIDDYDNVGVLSDELKKKVSSDKFFKALNI